MIARHIGTSHAALCGSIVEGPEVFFYDLGWFEPTVANCGACRALAGLNPLGRSILDPLPPLCSPPDACIEFAGHGGPCRPRGTRRHPDTVPIP